jgi:hypothetical protein
MANDCIPIFEPGDRVTCHATAALTGKRFCDISGDAQAGFGLKGLVADPLSAGVKGLINVGAPSAAGKGFGVAAWDVASGGDVTVIRGRGMIVPVTASNATITAGQEVEIADTTGRVKTLAAGVAVGRAVASCLANADVAISLY